MNNRRLPLFALSLLLVGGAIFFATRDGGALLEVVDPHEFPFPVEEVVGPADFEQGAQDADRTSGVEVDTPYGAWLGIEFVYQAEFRSVVEITAGESKQVVEHILSGRQLIRMVDRTHEGFVAAYSWPDLDLSLTEDGVEAPSGKTVRLREELARPVLVYYDDKEDPSGIQQALRFTPDTSTVTHNWARTLIAGQRAPISIVDEGGFDLVEADASGRHRSHYVILELNKDVARVSREKLEALDGVAWGVEAEAPVVSGDGVVEFSKGWFERVDWRERSELSVEAANLQINQHFTAAIDRISIGVFEGDGLDGWALTEDWFPFDGTTESDAALNSASAEFDAELLADADVGTLVNRLVSLDLAKSMGADSLLAAERLALLITEDPEALTMLQTELSSGRLPEGAVQKILGAIATAGTPEAQAALRELFLLPNPPDGLRDATVLALFQLPSVTTETVSAFHEVLSNEEAGVELRSASWLLLGAFAKTGSDPELTARLVSMESAAAEAGELISWLEALGNTRSPDVFEAASRHLGSKDADARLSAVRALRHLESIDATQALAEQAGSDEDAVVRREAISLLAGRPHDGVVSAVSELLREEPEASVRRAALDAFVNRPMDNEVLELLSSVASSDPDSSLRSYALELLGT